MICHGDSPSDVHTRLFECLTLRALDVGLATVLVSFGERPLAATPTMNKQDRVLWSNTDAAIDFMVERLVAAK